MTVGGFAARCQGICVQVNEKNFITSYATDSRDVKPGSLFIAIRGVQVDGLAFADTAMRAGAVAVLAEDSTEVPHIRVSNIVEALANFGSSLRSEFTGPVIGVTGSNGKTTTKELIAAALAPIGPVLKSPANKNTEFSSPLVWAESEGKSVAVIEMAMRGHGQIAHLARISRPDIGVVTCIGTAHVEKVGSREGVMTAKAELLHALPTDGTAIIWNEDDFASDLRARTAAKVRTFGFSHESDCIVVGYRATTVDSCIVRLQIGTETAQVELPTVGRHQALNAAAAVLVADTCGVKIQESIKYLDKATFPEMRMEVREFHGATILVDTYNASPDSTVAAIRALDEVPCSGRRIVVLGEMKELGDFAESGHRMVGKALSESRVEYVFLAGAPTRFTADEATMAGYSPARIDQDDDAGIEEIRELLKSIGEGDVVLLKASRALGFERALEGH